MCDLDTARQEASLEGGSVPLPPEQLATLGISLPPHSPKMSNAAATLPDFATFLQPAVLSALLSLSTAMSFIKRGLQNTYQDPANFPGALR